MPLYRYRCDRCGHTFSELEPAQTAKVRACGSCGSRRARRMPSRVGVHFKGSGFYKTNYPKRSSQSSNSKTQTETASPSRED